jgi:phage terminase Nu1 subunit (DNA packaging protein)
MRYVAKFPIYGERTTALGLIVNRAELTQLLGYSERTITKYIKAGMPRIQEGREASAGRAAREWKFGTREVLDWLRDRSIEEKLRRIENQKGAKARVFAEMAIKAQLADEAYEGVLHV